MELTLEKLNQQISDLENALVRLHEALTAPETDLTRDATIQRFEFCFELTWKTLKSAAEISGLLAPSPRDAIRTTAQLGLLTNPEKWFEYLTARNLSSHTYNETLAKEVYETAREFLNDANKLVEALRKKFSS